MMKLWERTTDAPHVPGARRSRSHPYLVLCRGTGDADGDAIETDDAETADTNDDTTDDRARTLRIVEAATGGDTPFSLDADRHDDPQTAVVYQWVRIRR